MKKIFFLFILNLLMFSCARVGSPNGGTKDTLAPKFLSSNIDSPRIRVSQNLRELRLDFNEYINLKDINKNLIISPPIKKIKKIIPSNLANKYVLIQWEDTLKTNTTYNFNFGNSIVDNNEGNVLPYYNFAFSTGEKLDSLYIAGTVTDALSLQKNKTKTNKDDKEKSVVVGLYKDEEKQNFKQKPYYITKVDDENYFELNYISAGNYFLIAFEDQNQNSVYDAGKEKVSFLKEKLKVDKSISGLKLKLVPSKKLVKYVEMKPITGGIAMLFEGKPENIEVKTVGEELKDYKITHHSKSDSVNIWFNAKQNKVGIENGTSLKFSYKTKVKQDTVSIFYKINPKDEFSITNEHGNLLAPLQEFKILGNMPVNLIKTESWKLESDSISQDFTAKISEKNPNEILLNSNFKIGKKYSLTVPKETVSSYYDSIKKTYRFDFETDTPENYGSIVFNLTNKPKEKFWIQLLNDKDEILFSKYTNDTKILFPYLKPNTYFARILVDNNENETWDEADFSTQTQGEDTYLFYKKIEAKPMWEIVEDWDLTAVEQKK